MQVQLVDRVTPSQAPHRLPYVGAIDGLRAVAVLAVLVYHADVAWIHGGFLGVEIFFVISGYLITALLLAEFEATGRIGFREFWVRRARRLFPALLLFLVGTTALAAGLARDAMVRVLLEIPAALTYVYNWFSIVAEQSYFEALERPSFLQHLWSLAIEEQFYLIWPFVLFLGIKVIGKRGTLFLVLAAVAGSTLLMVSLFVPLEDPSRIYLGTDTRMAGILIGAALAFVWDPHRARRAPGGWPGTRAVDIAGALGMGVLAICLITLRDDVIGAPLLYRGGFLIVSIATALTISAAAMPGSGVAKILGTRLLRTIGLRSYAIYLWHWPVFLLMRPGVDVGIDGIQLFGVRVGVTFVLAEVSYQLFERPIRERRFLEKLERLIFDGPRDLRLLGRAAAAVACVVLVTSVLVGLQSGGRTTVAAAEAYTPAPSAERATARGPEPSGSDVASTSQRLEASTPSPAPGPAIAGTVDVDSQSGKDVAGAWSPPVTFNGLGDSVMLGAAGALEAIGLESLDAVVGRQWWDAADAAASMRRRGRVGDVFVLHLGNNGVLTSEMFDDVMQELAEARRVVVVNVKVPRRWETSVNAELAAGVARWPNAVLLDWHGIADGHQGAFVSDGVHLAATGRQLYANAIADAVAVDG